PWTRVNLMFQYRPEWKAEERKELRRMLNRAEIEEALGIAREAGLKNLVRGKWNIRESLLVSSEDDPIQVID
ncbi:MAG: hypothetical protein V3V93_02225, partial [bacterium]